MKPYLRMAAIGALTLSAQAADFSYYVLALSYAPNFCAQPGTKKDPQECGPGKKLGWVVHGLWPQNESGHGPERCGTASPVGAELVRTMLNYIPTASLIQHEWTTHGTCSGLSQAEYFAAIRRLRDSVRIPPSIEDLRQPFIVSPQNLESGFAQTNPGIPMAGFRIACTPDAGLQEVRICFDKSFVARPCAGMGECSKPRIGLLPVQKPR